jgi:hypothetical protein
MLQETSREEFEAIGDFIDVVPRDSETRGNAPSISECNTRTKTNHGGMCVQVMRDSLGFLGS